MMFAIAAVPLLVATGAAIDFARGVMVHQRLSAALDAAALAVGNATSKPSNCSSDPAAGSASNASCAPLQQLAQQYFDQNYDHSQDGSYGTPAPVSISISGQSVTLSTSLNLTLTLMGVGTLTTNGPTVGASSTVVWGQTKLWVALVLDNSGSMSDGDKGVSKMSALQDAITNSSYGLLKTLQAAALNDGDVMVGIVPFTRSVNIGIPITSPNAVFIDWGEWEAPPANISSISGSVGPGSSCPFTTRNQGFSCLTSSSNTSSTTSTIPSSGLICPSQDNGNFNNDHRARYYNGCWDSKPTYTLTTTTDVSTPTTQKQSCSQTGGGSITCTNSGNATTGNATTTTSTTTTPGYSGDSTTSSTSSSSTTSDGSQSCSGSGSRRKCTWTRTIVTTTVKETVTKTGTAPYSHTWTPNDHSTWSGCVMDRQQKGKQTHINGGTGWRTPSLYDYDESNTQPSNSGSPWDDSQFPAENPASCPAASVTTLSDDWTNLAAQVNAMKANGSTNQAIGVAHGWQLLTTGAPYGTGALPENTARVLILFSDGLNTQDRWVGNGSTEGTSDDQLIDSHETDTCAAAKADGVVIYSIFVHIGTSGSSDPLKKCASDTSKYYDLTSSSQIQAAFSDIAQKITNLHVSR